jgi:hypothetical protein
MLCRESWVLKVVPLTSIPVCQVSCLVSWSCAGPEFLGVHVEGSGTVYVQAADLLKEIVQERQKLPESNGSQVWQYRLGEALHMAGMVREEEAVLWAAAKSLKQVQVCRPFFSLEGRKPCQSGDPTYALRSHASCMGNM